MPLKPSALTPGVADTLVKQRPQRGFENAHAVGNLLQVRAFRGAAIRHQAVFELPECFSARLDHPARNAHYGAMGRNTVHHHAPRSYPHPFAQGDVAQHRRARPNHNVVAQRRVPLSFCRARASQGHALVQQNAVADFGRFPRSRCPFRGR